MPLDFKQIKDGTPLLVTFDDWFLAANGNSYKYAWGKCFVRQAKTVLGFEPRGGANWLLQIGEGEGALLAMGCRIHYAIVSVARPHQSTNIIFIE